MEMTPERFDEIADAVIEQLPAWVHAAMENVVVVVESGSEDPDLLGMYEGNSLVDRAEYGTAADGTFAMPDVITLYRDAILAACATEAEVEAEVRTTIVHEIAHHFGIDDDRLDALGWA